MNLVKYNENQIVTVFVLIVCYSLYISFRLYTFGDNFEYCTKVYQSGVFFSHHIQIDGTKKQTNKQTHK